MAFRDFLQACVFIVLLVTVGLISYAWFDIGHNERQYRANCIKVNGVPMKLDDTNICIARPYQRIELAAPSTLSALNGTMEIGPVSIVINVP